MPYPVALCVSCCLAASLTCRLMLCICLCYHQQQCLLSNTTPAAPAHTHTLTHAAPHVCQPTQVCIIDPAPLGIWPNNYGVWVDEFKAMGLGDCLEVIWPKAKVFLDSDNLGAK